MSTQDSGEIYMITNKINNKKYIGQTVSYLSSGRKYGVSTRWNHHVSDANNYADNGIRHFCNAIRKYGKDNFNIEILLICNLEMMDYYEKEFIKSYDTISPKGYNIEDGGRGNDNCKRLHQDTKEKLSKCQRFLNMKDEDKEKLLNSMEELEIDELPFGISYTHHTVNNYEGFTVKQNNGKLKSIISNGRTLTEKLEMALKYLEYYKINNIAEIEKMNNELEFDSKIMIRNNRLSNVAKEVIQKLGYNINKLPLYIRYETRASRFYVQIDKKNKYFTKNNPEKSLKEAIEYINNLQSTEIGLREVTFSMKA